MERNLDVRDLRVDRQTFQPPEWMKLPRREKSVKKKEQLRDKVRTLGHII